MRKFDIRFTSHAIIEADSFEEAAKIFLRGKGIPQNFNIESIEDLEKRDYKDTIANCETCFEPIFTDHSYEVNNEDGIYVHTSCVDPEDLARPSNEHG